MVSLEQLINALNVEQVPCSNIFSLGETEDKQISIFDKYIVSNKYDFFSNQLVKFQDYWLLKKKYKTDTFLYSVLMAIDENFRFISEVGNALKKIKYQMWIDLDEKNKYKELGYNFNRKMNRNILRQYFEGNDDTDKEEQCINYIIDYFPIQCFIIEDDEKKELGNFCDKRRNCPILLIKKEGNKYYPLLNEKNGIFNYTHDFQIEEGALLENPLLEKPLLEKGVQPKTDGDLQPKTDGDLQPKTDGDLQPKTDEDLQPKTDEDLQPKTDEDLQPKTDEDLQPKTDEEVQIEVMENKTIKYKLAEISKIAKENKIILSYLNKETNKRVKKTLQQLIDECKEKELI